MIEAGQAVYFIENRGMDPVIKFGIVRGSLGGKRILSLCCRFP